MERTPSPDSKAQPTGSLRLCLELAVSFLCESSHANKRVGSADHHVSDLLVDSLIG